MVSQESVFTFSSTGICVCEITFGHIGQCWQVFTKADVVWTILDYSPVKGAGKQNSAILCLEFGKKEITNAVLTSAPVLFFYSLALPAKQAWSGIIDKLLEVTWQGGQWKLLRRKRINEMIHVCQVFWWIKLKGQDNLKKLVLF